MNTLSIMGLGKVAIHNCHSVTESQNLRKTIHQGNIAVLQPYAFSYIRTQNQTVELSGALVFPNGDIVDLYSGGALDNITEVILASLVIQSPEYNPSDFALA